MTASTASPAPLPAAVEQLVTKLHSSDTVTLTRAERRLLASLLDEVAGNHAYAEANGRDDQRVMTAMWATVRARYEMRLADLTPKDVSR